MKITVTEKAQQWFKDEVGVQQGMYVGFFGKIYGKTGIHEGFSIGVNVGEPYDVLYEEEIGGITYYVEKNDEWFFSDYNLVVDYDDQKDEPAYEFVKA